MFEKISSLVSKKNFYQQLILKKEIESFLKSEKIENQVEIKLLNYQIKIFCKNPTTFHFLKLKEKNLKKILENFPSFKISIFFH